ncbi:SDR family oxidoreductase [Deinococcus lacus]|uniref:SDR family oxidoreductase n=1 Tax=Deinococcus lacus TaxID=392561 RepID=A0ABW1YF18_9DEIO
MAVLQPNAAAVVDACLSGDEAAALAAAAALPEDQGYLNYPSSKRALARWVRREAPTDAWAGRGIPLNAVAPSVVLTAMTKDLVNNDEGRALLERSVPMPLGGYATAEDVAWPILWLLSPENKKVTGQLLFVDGGTDAVLRGDNLWE